MSSAPKKAIVTPEHRAEAVALKALWEAAKAEGLIPSQAQVGEQFGIGNQNAVSQFLNGKTPLSLKAACGFASALHCMLADFSPRLAAEAETAAQFVQPKGWPFKTIRMGDIPAGDDPRLAQLEAVMRAVLPPSNLVETNSFAGKPPKLPAKSEKPTFLKNK